MNEQKLQEIRHSLAHLLGAAVLELYPDTKLTLGPAIDNGFYYDFDFTEKISDEALRAIEKKMKELLPTWTAFSHKEVSVEEALEYYKGNIYKQELINEHKDAGLTFYTCGNFTDLCRGGHTENPAQEIPADCFTLSRVAGAYWRGDEKNKMLTRIYGLAFENKEKLVEYEMAMEEAKKRDHRELGEKLDLFYFEESIGKGLPIWLPKSGKWPDV